MAEALAGSIRAWSDLYNNSKTILGAVTFGHIAGLLIGGGMAIAFDLETLRLGRNPTADRAAHLSRLGWVHRWVAFGLALTILTGILMVMSDTSTFLRSPIFWSKMAVVVLLMANGWLVTRPAVRVSPADLAIAWPRVTFTAAVSLFLWLMAAAAGVVLMTAS
jgi:hypothetical protein